MGRTEEPSWCRRVTHSCSLFYVERSVVSLHLEGARDGRRCVSRRRRGGYSSRERPRTMNYEGVGLRRRRRTQDVAQTNALLEQLILLRSGVIVVTEIKQWQVHQFQAVRRRYSLGLDMSARSYERVTSHHRPVDHKRLSAAHWRAGARILRTSSNSILSYTLLSALIATQSMIPLLQKAPTPARRSYWVDKKTEPSDHLRKAE